MNTASETSISTSSRDSDDRFFGRNISPPGGNRPSSNYVKGRKKIREQVILRSKSNPGRGPTSDPMPLGKTRSKEGTSEVFTISQERLDQYMTMGATLITNCKQLLADIVQENMEMDYSGVNKACAMDMYPLPEEGEGLASLMGYPYKCFLQLPKEYSQIRMAEEDEEKTGFHIEEGVYCFTHMPKELKNSATTLQRMMEKVLTDQRGRNVEIYLEEIVIKSKSKPDLVQDVKEILRKLKG
ncbi:hypothetical protein Tco_0445055 [Tanacetum coccineum]